MTEEGTPELLEQLRRFSFLQDLKLCNAFVDETMFIFVCTTFRDLISLNVGDNPALLNVPPEISQLKKLIRLDVSNCESLLTFPDELLELKCLTDIDARGCRDIAYPPKTIADAGREKIFQFLGKAASAPPLKRVKVMFLGNGRSGKTSLLRTLAKKPLALGDPGPPSTWGVDVDSLEDLLTPSKLDKLTNGGLPDISFWDFAGQLEYSAAHDFFMSHRQAVYVIIFSVAEERESQMNQVSYWLRTVVAKGVSQHVRFLLVGTKVDLIEDGWDSVVEKLNAIEVDMRSVVRSCCHKSVVDQDRYRILFATSMGTHAHYKSMRRHLKGWIFASCRKIFEGSDLKMLRFPNEYKKVLDSIQKLKWGPGELPLLKLEDVTDVKRYGEHLVNAHRYPAKIEALKVLHDVGAIIFCMIKEQGCDHPWICPKPQIIADVIAVFSDPQSDLPLDEKACATRETLEKVLVEEYLGKNMPRALLQSADNIRDAAQKLFGFLLALHIFSPTEFSEVSPSESVPASSSSPEFIVPSALKGRPSFWSEVFGSLAFAPEDLYLRGFRFTCKSRMVTVAAFVKVMSSRCSDRTRMWGCAFSFELKSDSRVIARMFVRLAESRDGYDVIVIGSDLSPREKREDAARVEDALSSISSQLSCSNEIHDRLYLCPHCCSSDMYVRSGAAHAFCYKQIMASESTHPPLEAGTTCDSFNSVSNEQIYTSGNYTGASSKLPEPAAPALSCSRYHEVARPQESLLKGLCVGVLGGQGMLALHSQVSCTKDSLRWKPVSRLGTIELDDTTKVSAQAPPKLFKVMPNSFLKLTLQLEDGELLSQACMQAMNDAIRSKATVCYFDPPLQRNGCDVPLAQLKLEFSVGSEIGAGAKKKVIAVILSCSGTSEIESQDGNPWDNVVTTKCEHGLIPGSRVMLSAGGVICRVSDVFSEKKLRLQPEEPASEVASTSDFGNRNKIDITTTRDHAFKEGATVLLSVPEDNGGKVQGVICKVSSVKSSKTLTLTREPPSDVPLPLALACGAAIQPMLPVVAGTTIIPMLERFSYEDNVLVLYHIPQFVFLGKQPAHPVVDERGRIPRNSFFALTKQLKEYDDRTLQAYDEIVHPSKQNLESNIETALKMASAPHNAKVRVQFLEHSNPSSSKPSKARDRDLKLGFNVGEYIGGKRIEYIFSCPQKGEVESASESGDITTTRDHAFKEGATVLLSVPEDNGGKVQGVICKVSSVKSSKTLTLTREPPSDVPLPLALACGAAIQPMLESFSVSDHVSVVLKERPPFDVFSGITNELDILQLAPSDCSRSNEAAFWRDVEDNWAIMLGHEFQNYEITGMTLFRCKERERLFLEEVKQLERIAPLRPTPPNFSCAKLDLSPEQKNERAELQKQVMGHFRDFSQKFSLLPVAKNQDINLSVAWWGKWPSVYHGAAQNGFWDLPSHLKIDPGYFGEGFYLTRYPRYSDYYINGFRSCPKLQTPIHAFSHVFQPLQA